MSSRSEGLAWAATVVLALGAVYEALVALEVIPIGDVPGEGAPGGGVVLAASLLSYLVGVAVFAYLAVTARSSKSLVWVVLPVVATAYMVAHWLSFDPYYAPGLRRYADGGVHGGWVAAVAAAGIVAAALTRLVPRLGAALAAVVLLVEALTVYVMPLGK